MPAKARVGRASPRFDRKKRGGVSGSPSGRDMSGGAAAVAASNRDSDPKELAMTRLLNLLRPAPTAARTPRVPALKAPSFQPVLEALERREVPALISTGFLSASILDATTVSWSGYIRR
jgi:hypothetical protein